DVSIGLQTSSANADLWSAFAEDVWSPIERWTFVASGRADHHPFTGWVGSPRGSVIFEPVRAHALRVSAGSSFRNPTLLENYADFTQRYANADPRVPNPPFTAIQTRLAGNRALVPER